MSDDKAKKLIEDLLSYYKVENVVLTDEVFELTANLEEAKAKLRKNEKMILACMALLEQDTEESES